MNNPELYLRHKNLTAKSSADIIKKYCHLLDHSNNNVNAVLDIGSGPGHITRDVLYLLFEHPACKIVGFDISKEMVDYANKNFGNQSVSFEVFDIANEVPRRYISYFDYVFSSLTFQWIKDQKKLYSNVYKVIKPNGQMLVTYIAQTSMFDVYQTVWRKPEYWPYISDFNAVRPAFHESLDPDEDLKALLEQVGFEVNLVKIESTESERTTTEHFKEMLISINPVYATIPNHLKNKFILDHLEEISKRNAGQCHDSYYLEMDVFVVYARKKYNKNGFC